MRTRRMEARPATMSLPGRMTGRADMRSLIQPSVLRAYMVEWSALTVSNVIRSFQEGWSGSPPSLP